MRQVGSAAAAWDKPCSECDDTCEASTCEWTRKEPAGAPPSPRAGHAAAIFEGKLFVIGGESASGQPLADCHVLDFDEGAMSWSSLVPPLPLPLSNHCAVSLPAIVSSFCFSEPTLFIFGGRTLRPASPPPDGSPVPGPPNPTPPPLDIADGITLLHRAQTDGQLTWRTQVAAEESPRGRELSALVYDDEPSQVIVGAWGLWV
jgi:hypothetical protein